MKKRRQWWRASIAALLALGLAHSRSYAFVESTDTEGELPGNVSGVWLLVTHMEFPDPTPTPGAAGAPTPAPDATPAQAAAVRKFNVVNLLRVVHLAKSDADVMRAALVKMEQNSADKAKAILAKEPGSIPVQTATGEVEGGAKVVVPSVAEIRKPGTGDDVSIFLLDVAFPKTMQDEIDKAQNASKAWEPTEKDLAQLKTGWSTLKPSGRDEYSKIEWKVYAADKFDDNFQSDPATKDSKFAFSGNEEMIPKPNVPKTNIIVYGVDEMKGNVMSGKHTRAMMASVPFPLPIEMHGIFKMYKVADLPKSTPEKAEGGGTKKGEGAAGTKQGAKK